MDRVVGMGQEVDDMEEFLWRAARGVFDPPAQAAAQVRRVYVEGSDAHNQATDLQMRAFDAIQQMRNAVDIQRPEGALAAFDGATRNAAQPPLDVLRLAQEAFVAAGVALAGAREQHVAAVRTARGLVDAYEGEHAGFDPQLGLRNTFRQVIETTGAQLGAANQVYVEATARMEPIASEAAAEMERLLANGHDKSDLEAAKLMDEAQKCIGRLRSIGGIGPTKADDVSRAVDRLATSKIKRTTDGWAVLGGRLDARTRHKVGMAWLKIHARRVSRGAEKTRELRESLGTITQRPFNWDTRGNELAAALKGIPALKAERATADEAAAEIKSITSQVITGGILRDDELDSMIQEARRAVEGATAATAQLSEEVSRAAALVVERLDRVTRDTGQPLPAGDLAAEVEIRERAFRSALEIANDARDAASGRDIATGDLVTGMEHMEEALRWHEAEVVRINEARKATDELRSATDEVRRLKESAAGIMGGAESPAIGSGYDVMRFAREVERDVAARQAKLSSVAKEIQTVAGSTESLREQLSALIAGKGDEKEHRPAWDAIEESAKTLYDTLRNDMTAFDEENRRESDRLVKFVERCIQSVQEKCGDAVASATRKGAAQPDTDKTKAYQMVSDCADAIRILSKSVTPPIQSDQGVVAGMTSRLERIIGPRPAGMLASASRRAAGFVMGLIPSSGGTKAPPDVMRAGLLSRARAIADGWKGGDRGALQLGRDINSLWAMKAECDKLDDDPADTETPVQISDIALQLYAIRLRKGSGDASKFIDMWNRARDRFADGDAQTIKYINSQVERMESRLETERRQRAAAQAEADHRAWEKKESDRIKSTCKEQTAAANSLAATVNRGGRPPRDWYTRIESMFAAVDEMKQSRLWDSHRTITDAALYQISRAALGVYKRHLVLTREEQKDDPGRMRDAADLWDSEMFRRTRSTLEPGEETVIPRYIADLRTHAREVYRGAQRFRTGPS